MSRRAGHPSDAVDDAIGVVNDGGDVIFAPREWEEGITLEYMDTTVLHER